MNTFVALIAIALLIWLLVSLIGFFGVIIGIIVFVLLVR